MPNQQNNIQAHTTENVVESIQTVLHWRPEKYSPDIGNVVESIQTIIDWHPEKYSPEFLAHVLEGYQKKWEWYRQQTLFSPAEQAKITKDLENMTAYWNTQMWDKVDPDDDDVRNYAWARYVLESWQEGCSNGQPKLLPIGEGKLTQQTRDDIILWYANRKLIKK